MMHSTGDTQVPFAEFEKLLDAAEQNDIDVTTFIREGDEHFICYEQYVDDPTQDAAFRRAILEFFDENFY
jgi:dipeptidyl aminopeptidase/acylaminoacyl peptidase